LRLLEQFETGSFATAPREATVLSPPAASTFYPIDASLNRDSAYLAVF
jgi:hypothetical protein